LRWRRDFGEGKFFVEVKKRKRNVKEWFIYDLEFVKEVKFK